MPSASRALKFESLITIDRERHLHGLAEGLTAPGLCKTMHICNEYRHTIHGYINVQTL